MVIRMQADIKVVGQRISSRRKSEKIKQCVLAERLDISNNHMSEIENGKTSISFDLFCRICTELNVTPDYLLLGATRSSHVSQKIMDKLRLCSDSELAIIDTILEAFIAKHSTSDKYSIF